ncbi:phospholipase, patatin family protein [Cardiosporidium cionae]|uniref:Phospholipase, patatin family protein n=1 Tax=Cardiosporidium cionae TaxID=476202 RepID=A0ABQ7JF84_9APIC|nr:phospholipase, patatin family protein [Cardiosporidium cionae]|eukprot:KAF8822626.1 phospholipase, patatin family protein [Cardiosporidium cionae]
MARFPHSSICSSYGYISSLQFLKIFTSLLLCHAASAELYNFSDRATQGKCNGLVLSSGGTRGSYEAGAIFGLTQGLPAADVKWHIVSGVSIGSINSLSAMPFQLGEESSWAKFLQSVWSTIQQSDVYQEWPFREIEGLLFKSGIYDYSPFEVYLNKTLRSISEQFRTDRQIIISATNIANGAQKVWTEKENVSMLIDAAIASSSIPGVFPVKKIGEEEYVDGSVIATVNIQDAITQCMAKDEVKHPSDITIDIIACTPLNLNDSNVDFTDQNVLNILLRANYLSSYGNMRRMISSAQKTYPEVNFRFLIAPNMTLPNKGLDFDRDNLLHIFELGKDDGLKAANEYRLEKSRYMFKTTSF